MDGCGSRRRFEDTRDWLNEVSALKRPEAAPHGWVPGTQYLYAREVDGKVIEKNGGAYASAVYEPGRGVWLERFWIRL